MILGTRTGQMTSEISNMTQSEKVYWLLGAAFGFVVGLLVSLH